MNNTSNKTYDNMTYQTLYDTEFMIMTWLSFDIIIYCLAWIIVEQIRTKKKC